MDKLTFEELFSSLLPKQTKVGESNSDKHEFDPAKVWELTAKRSHWSDIGFTSESEYAEYLIENPYSNL